MIDADERNQEITAMMVDRLITSDPKRDGNRIDRDIIPRLYERASAKLGGKPVSLVAAQKMFAGIKPSDNVFLVSCFGAWPINPFAETDGPLGIASLARAVRFGLGAIPIIVTGSTDMGPVCRTVEAAQLQVMDYKDAKELRACAASITFPIHGKEGREESRKFAAKIIDEYAPKAAISVESVGPNKKGVKHFGNGKHAEAMRDVPSVEYIFTEANARGILTIGAIDQGNEIGSGTIEEDVREITPFGDKCQCPCGAGLASSTKTDVVLPAAVSNWGGYAIAAMVAYLVGDPSILHDASTERRMLEACIRAGANDGNTGRSSMSVDGMDIRVHEAVITILHEHIKNALKGVKVSS